MVTNMKDTFEHYLEQVFGFVKNINFYGREMWSKSNYSPKNPHFSYFWDFSEGNFQNWLNISKVFENRLVLHNKICSKSRRFSKTAKYENCLRKNPKFGKKNRVFGNFLLWSYLTASHKKNVFYESNISIFCSNWCSNISFNIILKIVAVLFFILFCYNILYNFRNT